MITSVIASKHYVVVLRIYMITSATVTAYHIVLWRRFGRISAKGHFASHLSILIIYSFALLINASLRKLINFTVTQFSLETIQLGLLTIISFFSLQLRKLPLVIKNTINELKVSYTYILIMQELDPIVLQRITTWVHHNNHIARGLSIICNSYIILSIFLNSVRWTF